MNDDTQVPPPEPSQTPAPEVAAQDTAALAGTSVPPPQPQQRRSDPGIMVYAAVYPVQHITLPKADIRIQGDEAIVPLAVNGALGVFPVFASVEAARALVGPDGGVIAVPFRPSLGPAPVAQPTPPPAAEDPEVGGKLLNFTPKI